MAGSGSVLTGRLLDMQELAEGDENGKDKGYHTGDSDCSCASLHSCLKYRVLLISSEVVGNSEQAFPCPSWFFFCLDTPGVPRS